MTYRFKQACTLLGFISLVECVFFDFTHSASHKVHLSFFFSAMMDTSIAVAVGLVYGDVMFNTVLALYGNRI